jgi:hypothetical protein
MTQSPVRLVRFNLAVTHDAWHIFVRFCTLIHRHHFSLVLRWARAAAEPVSRARGFGYRPQSLYGNLRRVFDKGLTGAEERMAEVSSRCCSGWPLTGHRCASCNVEDHYGPLNPISTHAFGADDGRF